ncbi:MAG: hypothetical protein ACFCVB_22350 [Nodosilinea sp.]
MPDTVANPLVEQITEQLKTLSAADLQTIQDFVAYLAWKHQPEDAAAAPKKSAEARAIERIADLDDPTQWVTVIEAGAEVDEDVLNNWLKARGYQD